MGLFDQPELTRVTFGDDEVQLRSPTLGELQDAREVAAKKRQKNLAGLPEAAVTAIFSKQQDDDDPDLAQEKADRISRKPDIPTLVEACLVDWSDDRAVSKKAIRALPAAVGLKIERAMDELVKPLIAETKAPVADFPPSTED